MLPDFAELLEPPQLFGFSRCKFYFLENIGFFNKTGLREISGIIFFIPIWLDNIKLQSITHKAIFNYLKHMGL